jgi:hypothetical protein
MKKIISIFCTLAMVLSMAFTVSADENNYIKFVKVDSEAGQVVFDAILVTNETVGSMSATWDASDAIAKGATAFKYEVLKSGANANANKSRKALMVGYTSAVEPITGEIALARFTLTGDIKEDISLPCTKSYCTAIDADGNNSDVDMTVPTTLKVVEDVVKTADVKDVAVVSEVAPSGKATFGISGVVAGGAAFSKIKFAIADTANDLTADYVWELGTSIDANDVAFGLNIWGAPTNAEITATAVAE